MQRCVRRASNDSQRYIRLWHVVPRVSPVEQDPPQPDRRIPGWKVVLVLVIIGVVVLVPAFFLRFPPRFGPPLLFLHVTEEIRATPESANVSANLGPHCTPVTWDPSTRSLTATSEVVLTNVVGLLLQRFEVRSENIRSDGGDYIRPNLAADGSTWTLTSPVDDRVLVTFTLAGENVTIDGSTYGPQDSWPLSFTYDVVTPGGTVQIQETLTVTNEGILRPRIVLPGACM